MTKKKVAVTTVGEVRELISMVRDTASQLKIWQQIYQEVFGIELALTEGQLPARKPGLDQLVVKSFGVTTQRVYDQCGQGFKVRKYTERSLTEMVSHDDRGAKDGTYAIWIRCGQESDMEWRSVSANQLKQSKVQCVTLCERLLLELLYWRQTGKHLDFDSGSLCAGSRDVVDYVPYVKWISDIGELRVLRVHTSHAHPRLGAREVVS